MEFVDQFLEVKAERDQLRQELDQCQRELRATRDHLSQSNSLKDAAELQSKNWEKQLPDLSKESAENLESERRLAQQASDARLTKEVEKEGQRTERLVGAIGSLAGKISRNQIN